MVKLFCQWWITKLNSISTYSKLLSKLLSNEKFTPLSTTNKSLSPKLIWSHSRIRLKFEGSCLKQEDKALFTPNDVVNSFFVYKLDISYISFIDNIQILGNFTDRKFYRHILSKYRKISKKLGVLHPPHPQVDAPLDIWSQDLNTDFTLKDNLWILIMKIQIS